MTQADSEDGFFKLFGPRPIVPFLSLIIGVGAVAFAIYSHFVQQRTRELTYYVHPVRAAVVVPGQSPDLKVLHEGKEIEGGVTATQVAIWNAGSLEIEPQDFLDKVEIYTEPHVPILKATVRKATRDIIDFRLRTTALLEGIVPISWKILEKNDGAWVQISHSGGTEVEVRVRATIKGQGPITRMYYPGKIQSAEEQLRKKLALLRSPAISLARLGYLG